MLCEHITRINPNTQLTLQSIRDSGHQRERRVDAVMQQPGDRRRRNTRVKREASNAFEHVPIEMSHHIAEAIDDRRRGLGRGFVGHEPS